MFEVGPPKEKVIEGLKALKAKRIEFRNKHESFYTALAAEAQEMIKIATGKDSDLYTAFKDYLYSEETDPHRPKGGTAQIAFRIMNYDSTFDSVIDSCIAQVEAVGLPRIPQESKNVLGTIDNAAMLTIITTAIALSFGAGVGITVLFPSEKGVTNSLKENRGIQLILQQPVDTVIIRDTISPQVDTLKGGRLQSGQK